MVPTPDPIPSRRVGAADIAVQPMRAGAVHVKISWERVRLSAPVGLEEAPVQSVERATRSLWGRRCGSKKAGGGIRGTY
jgi:hypothetical protein